MSNNYSADDILDVTTDVSISSFKRPSFAQMSILYSAIAAFLVLGVIRFRFSNSYIGVILNETIFLLAPALLLVFVFKLNSKKIFKLNSLKISNIFLVPILVISAIPIVGILNTLYYVILKLLFGKTELSVLPVPSSIHDLLVSILVVAGVVAICEEFLFRGLIQSTLERLGVTSSILITAFLFGLFHMDIEKLLSTFLLGILIGFIVYRTNSIWGGIIAHFTNNAISLILAFVYQNSQYIQQSQQSLQTNQSIEFFNAISSLSYIELGIFVSVLLFVFGCMIALFCALTFAFIKNTSKSHATVDVSNYEGSSKSGLLWLLPGFFLICSLYAIQIWQLTGHNIESLKRMFQNF